MWKCRVKWVIILQEFKEILWNILKKLKQLLKCVSFMQIKCGKILIKIYTLLSKLWRKFSDSRGNITKFWWNIWKSLKKTRSNLKKYFVKICRNSGKNLRKKWEKFNKIFYRNTSMITHSLSIQFLDTSAPSGCGVPTLTETTKTKVERGCGSRGHLTRRDALCNIFRFSKDYPSPEIQE